MNRTCEEIQKPLESLMAQAPYSRFFQKPKDQKVGEFTLCDEGKPFRADACYEIGSRGRLFIEHDSSQTALNNLAKYWILASHNRLIGKLFLVHIIDNKRPASTRLCRFIGERFEKDVPDARYYLREVSDWHNSEWKDRLVEVLKEIIGTLANESPGPVAGTT